MCAGIAAAGSRTGPEVPFWREREGEKLFHMVHFWDCLISVVPAKSLGTKMKMYYLVYLNYQAKFRVYKPTVHKAIKTAILDNCQ